ncbi:MAG: TerC family protein [Candidatus Rokubacteria bacterium]|nr:TerC family protein [Candidatus Rokubacteria bacterium]
MNLTELITLEFWLRWWAIVVLDLTLAGDNALVIALAVRNLPSRQQWQGRLWGTFGAVALRVLFIGVITALFSVPLLQAIGGAVLLWIAVKLLSQEGGGDHAVRHGTTLPEAIWIIILADVIMSLDNVLAVAAAAHGDMLLVIFGVGLSIPIVIWGSGLVARLMGRFAWIVDLGAGILGWVAGEMILKDAIVRRWIGEGAAEALHWVLPAVLGIGVIVTGRWWVSRRARQSAERGASRT